MERSRYIGFQSRILRRAGMLSRMGDYSCLFLCLCSIADEWRAERMKSGVDILALAMDARDSGFLDDEWTCRTTDILRLATGVGWKKSEVRRIPSLLPENMYTVEKWFNRRTGLTHFRRRWGDTLDDSVTVREGRLEGYYVFEPED